MTVHDYSHLDNLIIKTITDGMQNPFRIKSHRPLVELARSFVDGESIPEWLIIENRLLAMRKTGKLKRDGIDWIIAN